MSGGVETLGLELGFLGWEGGRVGLDGVRAAERGGGLDGEGEGEGKRGWNWSWSSVVLRESRGKEDDGWNPVRWMDDKGRENMDVDLVYTI